MLQLETRISDLASLASVEGQPLVLFGPPGAGKNYLGEALVRQYGYTFYDTDLDFPPAMRQAKQNKQPFTPEMRAEWYGIVHAQTQFQMERGDKLVVGSALVNDRFRVEWLERFPNSQLVLVAVDTPTLISRCLARPTHGVSVEQALRSGAQFEPVSIPHLIYNNI